MSKVIIILITSLFFCLPLVAQSGFFLSSAVGTTWNNELVWVENKVDSPLTFASDLSANFRFRLFKNISSEVGMGGRYILSRGTINNIDFNSQTLRLILPVSLGISLAPKWYLSAGVTFQNNKDFINIDLRDKYFWRLNGILMGQYTLSKKWSLFTKYSYGLRGITDALLVNDPRHLISTGLHFNL